METFARSFGNLLCYKPNFAASTWLFRIAPNPCLGFVWRKRLPPQSLQGW
jgi:DNA-directed RNA polymerase specialized sigma24 family protein